MAAKLELIVAGNGQVAELTAVRRVVDAVNASDLDWLQAGHVNLKLIDDADIRALNKNYSGKDKATDVLSFSYIEGGQAPQDGELGDIAISTETAQRQATAAGTSLADELALLALHGILHIHGFDHASASDQAVMDKLQSQLLATAGVTYRDFQWS